MNDVVQLQIWQFSLVYTLLIIVAVIMKVCKVNLVKQLLIGNIRMTVQLILAGLILTYIFENPHPIFTVLYICVMVGFSIYRVFSRVKGLNSRFKLAVAIALSFSGLCMIIFFVTIVVGESVFNPQYTIPLAGMILGNSITGVTLGLNSFKKSVETGHARINALQCIGAKPSQILFPFVREALETAMLPTLNSIVGMGIVSLPGMMTGQILSGTLPMTAILYQIAIMVTICTVVCLACFGSLYFGYKTLYDKTEQIVKF